jgi:hypothetical protein
MAMFQKLLPLAIAALIGFEIGYERALHHARQGRGLRAGEPEMTEDKRCSICGKAYVERGNNAEPVNEGRCCDECNATIVLPARLAQAKAAAT